MSLILDALKKSEAERQRGQVPNLLSPLPTASTHALVEKKANLPWLVLLAVALSALLIAYFYFNKPIATRQVAPPISSGQTTTEVGKTEPSKVAASIPAVIAESKPAPAPIIEPMVPIEQTPNTIAKTIAPTASDVVEPIPETNNEPRIASMAEMPADQRQQLPALKLSMHVYSSESGKRFAIIDGQRVNEGSTLGSAVIEQIRHDGVVLSVQGQSYLLPRP